MVDLIREVDEDMQREKFARFWHSFGSYIIGGSIAVVFATGGIVLWQNQTKARHEEQTAALVEAYSLLEAGKAEEAATGFAKIRMEGKDASGALAGFGEAQARITLGKWKDAQIVYEDAARRAGTAYPALHDWASILATYSAGQAGGADAAPELADVTISGRPFAMTAQELVAVRELSAGNTDKAVAALKVIVENVQAPETLRARAKTLLLTLDPDYTASLDAAQPHVE